MLFTSERFCSDWLQWAGLLINNKLPTADPCQGMCHRDSACNYAHGYEELRKPAVSEGGCIVPRL